MNELRGLVTRQVSPRAAGIARIVLGAGALVKVIERAPVLERLSDPSVVRAPYLADQPSLADLPPELVVFVWFVIATAFTVGALTTMSGIVLTGLLAAVLLSDQQLYSNHLYLLTWLVGLMTLARSGSALSIDARMGRGRRMIPAWPLALVRLQVIVVYLFAGLAKVNLTYLSGSVVAASLRVNGPLAIPMEWRTFELMAGAAILSILTEIGLAVGLLLRKWRRTAFVVGLGLHVGIAIVFDPTLPLIVFALIILSPYVLFLDDRPRRLIVVWDDSCTFCRGWVAWFRRLDWTGAIRLVPNSNSAALDRLSVRREDADDALQLVTDESKEQGFRAVVGILEALPVSFLWAPLLRVWPIGSIGDAVYRRVAGRRSCGITRPTG